MNSLKNCSDAPAVAIRKGFALPVKKQILLFCLAGFIIMQACRPSKEKMEYREEAAAMADSVSRYVPGLAADTIDGVTHNFIRKADLRCKVKDVLTATKLIEDLVSASGGYAGHSDLSSRISYSTAIRFNKDSVLEQLHYTTISSLKLRVPNRQLDTVLRHITAMAVFVDYRTLSADDVKMKLFVNSLTEARLQAYKKRVEHQIDAKEGSKLNHVVAAEEAVLNKQSAADNKRIESFDLADQVNYSTLVVELYESQKINAEKTVAAVVVEPYEPPFTEKFSEAFLQGFKLLKNFILVITQCWSIIFIIAVIVFSGRKLVAVYNKRFNSIVK